MSFIFGRNAIHDASQVSQLHFHAANLAGELAPRTFLQYLLADELIHASWELERVRALSTREHIDSETSLHAASARASRSWSRAQQELRRLKR